MRSSIAGFPRTCAFAIVVFALAATAGARADVANFTAHPEPKPLSELAFQDGEGRSLTLAAFEGKVVLLNLWATWCAPCRLEMPTLSRLQDRLGGPDFEVLALSIDRAGLKAVREFYAEIGVDNLALYIDPTMKATRALGALGLPTTLLLDRQGLEIGRLIGPAEWDSPEAIALIERSIDDDRAQTTRGRR